VLFVIFQGLQERITGVPLAVLNGDVNSPDHPQPEPYQLQDY
jgi:hypothetical protein